jgi:hypothetical protein
MVATAHSSERISFGVIPRRFWHRWGGVARKEHSLNRMRRSRKQLAPRLKPSGLPSTYVGAGASTPGTKHMLSQSRGAHRLKLMLRRMGRKVPTLWYRKAIP